MGPLAREGSGGEKGYCLGGENSGGMFVDGEKWREKNRWCRREQTLPGL